MDERSRAMMPNTTDPETLRESLLGLLKVNPLTGIPAAQAAAAAFVQQQQQQAAYGGGAAGDYRMGASGGYPGYAASLNPAFAGPSAALTAALSTGNMQGLAQFASDPVQLQKALASLGMLGQQGVQAGLGGGGGGVATASPVTQQQQSHQQQSHSARDSQQQQSAIAGYGSAGSGRGQQQSGGQQSEENGSIGYPSSHQQQAGGHGGVGVQQVGHSQQQASTGGGGGVGQYAQYTLGQNGHAQQGLTAGHMATLARGAGGVPQSGSSGQVGGATGGGGSMYVTTSGTTGAGSYMMQQAQQQQQPQAIQRTLAQQQTAYSARRWGLSEPVRAELARPSPMSPSLYLDATRIDFFSLCVSRPIGSGIILSVVFLLVGFISSGNFRRKKWILYGSCMCVSVRVFEVFSSPWRITRCGGVFVV